MDKLNQVHEGMDVFDADGQWVGTVKSFKMGDPDAVSAEGQSAPDSPGLMDLIASAFGAGAGVDDERAERLLRLGYIEVDGAGLKPDFYVGADQIERVSGEQVYMNVQAP